jgi:hypothetical protein
VLTTRHLLVWTVIAAFLALPGRSLFFEPEADAATGCANQALRTGASAALPDCRAYELVTPSDTNGRTPVGLPYALGPHFWMRTASPAGDAVSFRILGGVMPGYEGTGNLNGDPYVSRRGPKGWSTVEAGPNAVETSSPQFGSFSPDQGYSFWNAGPESGTAAVGEEGSYLRFPGGHSELIGEGSLATDRWVKPLLISEDGQHVLFRTSTSGFIGGHAPLQLEPAAPPDGTEVIYDRTADGKLHVVSLLPTPGAETPGAGEHAVFLGASPDGGGVAFHIGSSSPIYLRVGNAETAVAAPPGATFAGVAASGQRLLYLEAGDLYAYDAEADAAIPFTVSGDATLVNVAAAGTVAYFVSPSLLATAPNPNGAMPQAGGQNLYLSEEGRVRFVGTVTERDVEGDSSVEGLGLWTVAVNREPRGQFNIDPSRTTADGGVLIFESRAALDGYDPQGTAQIYRFDASAETLDCLSCLPTLAAPSGNARLNSLGDDGTLEDPMSLLASASNLSSAGNRVFFMSPDPLVEADADGKQDVYEWEEEGVGSCDSPGGCVYLISSPTSGRDEFLYGASDSGDDVFILSANLLLPGVDPDETPSIFDARVGGGFAPPASRLGECLGEACQPAAEAPLDPTPATATNLGQGNLRPHAVRRRCPKGKRGVRRAGRRRCVPRRGREPFGRTAPLVYHR